MQDANLPNSRQSKIGRYARWVARVIGTLIAVFVLFMLLGHLFFDEEVEEVGDTSALVGVGVGVISVWIAASLLAGWRWEKAAGVSTVIVGVVLGIFVFFTAGRNELPVALAMSIPIILVGTLFLCADRTTPRTVQTR